MIYQKLSLVPHSPGCYLMKNKDNVIIYVGKSKNLKNRLTSYFHGKHTGKTNKLVSEITSFDYILTNTEMESLLLELNLIKKYEPKYNVIFRDDKTYPYIELTNEKIPRLVIVRHPNMKKRRDVKLFGPYVNVTAARKTVDLINRLYPLRKCKNLGKKECLYYHIGECLGYCNNKIDNDVINKMKNEIISFLNGNNDIIISKLKEKMENASNKLQYEKALEYKSLLDYINITLEKQKVELSQNSDIDIINYYFDKSYISIQILFIRGGKLLDSHNKIFPIYSSISEDLMTYIVSFYDKHKIRPKEILVPNIVDSSLLTEMFDTSFIIPIKGVKKKLLLLAYENALNSYNEKMELFKRDLEKTSKSIAELGNILGINNLRRIELFDNSNLFGSFNVSSMVVFIDGKPSKNDYRKFKITNDKNDDYNTMKEVIYRRYFRVIKDNLIRCDLIIVDGGTLQINAARSVLKELNLNIMVCGLKKDDKHNTCELLGFDPIREISIDKHSNLFQMLVRMQDEVHNYTISYHKQIRSKGALSSILDTISGIGEKRKNLLLKKYKTIKGIKEANINELKEIIPLDIAKNLKIYLEKDGGNNE